MGDNYSLFVELSKFLIVWFDFFGFGAIILSLLEFVVSPNLFSETLLSDKVEL